MEIFRSTDSSFIGLTTKVVDYFGPKHTRIQRLKDQHQI